MTIEFHPEAKQEFADASVIYQIIEQKILIVAVMHLHRVPGYWQNRVN